MFLNVVFPIKNINYQGYAPVCNKLFSDSYENVSYNLLKLADRREKNIETKFIEMIRKYFVKGRIFLI